MTADFTQDALPGLAACESPIESKLLQTMFDSWTFSHYYALFNQPDIRPKRCCLFNAPNTPIGILIQVELDELPSRRVDFVAEGMGCRVLVEVDGMKFHNDPKVMREDRKKDRLAAVAGYHTLRFTGPEVWEYPKFALSQIEDLCVRLSDENHEVWQLRTDRDRDELMRGCG